MARESRQDPAPTPGEPGPPDGPDPGFFRVVRNDEVVAAYDAARYSLDAVIRDLLARIFSGELAGPEGGDYLIWWAGRRVGAIYRPPARGPDTNLGTGGMSGPRLNFGPIGDDYRAV